MGDACRNCFPWNRRHAGTICTHMEKSGNDLHGMYRNWVKNEKTAVKSTITVYDSHKWICAWFCKRENISGEFEVCLCSRIKLLFLSRGSRLLPDGGAAGSAEPEWISDSVCRTWIFLSDRKLSGAFRLRMAVSFWIGAGPFTQNSCIS